MNKDLLGLGGAVPPGQEEIRLLIPEGTFATDDPYLLVDGKSLIAPLPIIETTDETYIASDGSLQPTWGAPAPHTPPMGREEPFNSVTVDGVPVTNDGAFVTNG